MGIIPGLYSPKVFRRVDWSKGITLKDSTGTAVNLSGKTFTSSVWNKQRTKKYCDMTVSITDSNNGKLEMSMTETQTTQLPDSCFYDLKSTVGSNTNYWLTGELDVKQGYTE
tara:strand:+ start:215 stop:550 length:336 start_codon:yes stop_codon:yes gene_type:complete